MALSQNEVSSTESTDSTKLELDLTAVKVTLQMPADTKGRPQEVPEKEGAHIPKAGPNSIQRPGQGPKEGKMEPTTEGEAHTKKPQVRAKPAQ